MRKLLLLLLFCPHCSIAQLNRPVSNNEQGNGLGKAGVGFEENLTWQQVKEKARSENKYIFLDCYATWCGPCKQMDKNVYSQDSIGDFINNHFVSVKIQYDTSKDDAPIIKSWYADAHQLLTEYHITAFPTFLFFSPDGKIVHRGIGYKRPNKFISLAKDAMENDRRYYTLVENFFKGKMDYSTMAYLASMAKEVNDTSIYLPVAREYVYHYLDKLNDSTFCTKANFDFLSGYAEYLSSKDKIIELCLHHPDMVDSVMKEKGYSRTWINYIGYRGDVFPAVEAAKRSGKSPDWNNISKALTSKFGASYAEFSVVIGKMKWYEFRQDWENYCRYLIERMEKGGFLHDTRYSGDWNDCAWIIFQRSHDGEKLEKATIWSEMAMNVSKSSGVFMDTKANLLYKLGRREEALSLERKAMQLAPADKDIQEAYKKMQEGKPTW